MSHITISLAPEVVGHLFGLPITNSMLGALLGALALALVAWAVSRNVRMIPGRLQNATEMVFEYFLGIMDGVTGDRQQTRRFFPWVMTIFLFILFMNWIGLTPIFGSIGLNEVEGGHQVFIPFLRGGSADLNMTVAIAMVSVIAAQFFGVMAIGAKKHLRKYFNPNPTMTFVGIIELIGEFTKIISFSFRLFGNIFAGEVLLLVITTLVPLIAPLPFYFLELFVGVVQALVFALLSLVFFKIAETAEAH